MKLTPLTTDSSLLLAAGLGAISFGAMLSLATAQASEKPECVERDEASGHGSASVISGCKAAPQPVKDVKLDGAQKIDAPDHVISVDKDGKIKCGTAKLPHPPIQHEQVKLLGAPVEAEIAGPCKQAPPKAINPAFDINLYQLLKADQGNVFFSPCSISECMAMVYAGTGGNTATEIGKALSYGKDAKITAGQFKTMRAYLAHSLNKGENKLSIANALCVTGVTPLQDYQNTVRQQFQGEIFSGGLDKINGWVKQKTEGNIEKILEELSPDSACVLLNAVYFKGNWKSSFNAGHTHKAPFHLTSGDKVKVDMMMQESSFKVFRENGVVAVELPYQTGASMVLILPSKTKGMAGLEKQLNPVMLDQLCGKFGQSHPQKIKLYLPKFKIETKYDLVEPMQQLGMKDAFSFEKSDFKAMYGESRVKISQIVHKATLEVDEKGSVATAATAVEIQSERHVIEPPARTIRFDRPFIALIRDRETGTNLFMGRINDPAAE